MGRYDAGERASRDRKCEHHAAFREGRIKGEREGEVRLIRPLQGILGLPATEEQEMRTMNLGRLQDITGNRQAKLRNRRGVRSAAEYQRCLRPHFPVSPGMKHPHPNGENPKRDFSPDVAVSPWLLLYYGQGRKSPWQP
jgi:hypothetical protein